MPMSNPMIKRTVESAFNGLHFLNHRGSKEYLNILEKKNVTEQRDHLRWFGQTASNAFPTPIIAKYFVVYHALLAVAGVKDTDRSFRPRDILHCKQSYVLTVALCDEYTQEFLEWAETVPDYFKEIEYGNAILYERGGAFDPHRSVA